MSFHKSQTKEYSSGSQAGIIRLYSSKVYTYCAQTLYVKKNANKNNKNHTNRV